MLSKRAILTNSWHGYPKSMHHGQPILTARRLRDFVVGDELKTDRVWLARTRLSENS
jgi:hypothetical protein